MFRSCNNFPREGWGGGSYGAIIYYALSRQIFDGGIVSEKRGVVRHIHAIVPSTPHPYPNLQPWGFNVDSPSSLKLLLLNGRTVNNKDFVHL